MTLVEKVNMKCPCGNMISASLYKSVNVAIDPALLELVRQRKINNFECEKCGGKSELIEYFLYSNNERLIFVYPKSSRSIKDNIMAELAEIKNNSKLAQSNLIVPDVELVFGYDELFEKIGLDKEK
jgi:hypothetical protein